MNDINSSWRHHVPMDVSSCGCTNGPMSNHLTANEWSDHKSTCTKPLHINEQYKVRLPKVNSTTIRYTHYSTSTMNFIFMCFIQGVPKKCPIAIFSLNMFQRCDYTFSDVFRNQNFEPIPSKHIKHTHSEY